MRIIRSRAVLREGIVVWELDANQFEFTWSEFQELLTQVRRSGLFSALASARPALLDQLRALFSAAGATKEEEKELEHLLEQALFGAQQQLPSGP